MLFTELEIDNKVYKLRLDTRSVITLEKQLGCNPLAIFGDGETIPPLTTMVYILYAALQPLNHGISLNETYDIFDKYLEEHALTDFLPVIVDIYKASGLIRDEKK